MSGAMIAHWLRRPLTAAILIASTTLPLLAGVCRAQNPPQTPPVLPQGGTVAAGSVSIVNPVNGTLNINQSSHNAVINWQSFSVGKTATVNFNQPTATASTLNRVTSATPSSVAGTINAPGKVLLVNSNGIAFTKDARVNVGSLMATSLSIKDEDYLSGKLKLQGNGASAAVSNAGTIEAGDGGFVALVGGSVANTGTIRANLGKIGLGAGEYVTIDPAGDGFLQVAVPSADADKLKDADGKPIKALVEQAGTIDAAGGQVAISAAAARTAAVDAVNISGTVRARSVSQQNGSITLGAGEGTAIVSGTLDASGVNDGETGGKVVALGKNVGLVAGARVDVSGAAGGGRVELGGSARGAGPLPNADGFYMDKLASIDASATKNGAGGQVVTWGTDSNRTWGTISARGAGFGSGGLVETSGHWLDVGGAQVNLRGDNGLAGEWLLDPTDITISIGLSLNGSLLGGLFTPLVGALTSIINTTDLLNALSTAGTVTISSASTGSSNGTLTLANNILYNSNNTATLNLISDSAMNLNAAISSIGNGTLNLNLTSGGAFTNGLLTGITLGGNSVANVNITAGGALTLNAGISASTPGLNLTLNSGGLLTTNALAPISYTGNTAGSVTLIGAGGISLFNNITSNNARLNITQIAGNGTTAGGNILLNNGITLNANGGNISLINALIPSVTNLHGIYVGNLVNLTTSGTGGINLVGYGNGASWGGIAFAGGTATLTSGTGGISLLGSADQNSGISFGNGAFSSTSLTSTGAISIDGRQTNSVLNGGLPVGYNGAVGFYGTTNINASGALSIIGTSEQGIGAPGIAFLSTPTVTLRGSSVALTGINNSGGVSGDATRTGTGLKIDTPITLIANSGDITLTGVSKSSYGAGISIGGANTYTLAAGQALNINGSNTAALTNTAVNIAAAINVAARPLNITGTGLTSITSPLTAANVSILQNFTGFASTSNAITLGSTITASGSLGVTSSTGSILSSSTFTSGTGQYAFATLSGGGNITFNNAVSYSGAAAGSFSAIADGILSNRNIVSTTAAMDITLSALNTASASASGLLLAGTTLNANGGNIILTGVGRGAGIAADASAGAGLGLTGTSSILTSGAGRISIDARNNGGSNNPAALYATGTSTLTAGTGGINILAIGGTGAGIQLGQQSGDASTLSSTGAITLNGSTSATASGQAAVLLGRNVGITASGTLSITGTAAGAGSQGGVVQSNPGTQTIRGASVSITGNTSGSGVGVGLTGTTTLTADTGNITLNGSTSSSVNAAVNLAGTLTTTLSAGAAASLNLIGSNSGNACVVATPALNAGLAAINITGDGTHSLSALTGGAITIAATGTALTNATSAITLGGDINATGAVSAVSQSGRVNVNGNIVTTATGTSAVVLAAGAAATAPVAMNTDARGNVVLASGKTITTGTNGRVLVYTGSIANTTGWATLAASGSGRFRYGRLFNDTSLLSGGTGVYIQYREQPVLTLTVATPSRTYDATTLNNASFSANLSSYAAINGYQNGDTGATSGNTLSGSLAFNGSVSTAVRNAGTYVLSPGTLASGLGYAFDIASGVPNLTITPRQVNLTASVDTRQYNGTTTSTAAPVLSALLGSDTSVGVGAQVFANKNAGTGKLLTPSIGSILISDGNGGNNYNVAPVTATGTITAAPLTVTASAGTPKTYDGTTSSTATPVVSGLFGTDAVTGVGVQVFADKNVGTGKIQLPSAGSLLVSDGNGGSNYAMQFVQNAAGSIVAAAATLRANVSSKTYDGGTSSNVTPSLLGAVGADVVVGAGTQTYDNKNVGAGVKVVTPTRGTLKFIDGNGIDVTSNYTITLQNNSTSTIAPATLTLTASAAVPKVYDGGLGSTGVPVVSGLLGSDSVVGQATQVFTDKNVGTGKTITAALGALQVNDGNSGNNYTIALVNNTSGIITPAALTLTATADRKTYDGNTSSLVLPQVTAGALLGSDTFTSRVQVFADDNAGTGKALIPSAVISDGNGGNNYLVTLVNNTAGIIDQRTLRVVPGTASKIYDGTTASIVVPNIIGLRTGDTLSGQAGQIYDDRNVGTSKTLTATLGTLAISDGNNGNNYHVQLEAADVGTVTARPITLTATAATKTYDGTTNSSATPLITVGALQSGDTATLSQVYLSKNAGTGLTLAPNAVISDGNGGNNYSLVRVNSSNGTINRATLEVTASTNSRVYDGTTNAAGLPTVTLGALQGTDGFSTFVQQYTGKNVGTSLTLVPTAVINDGNSGNNYNLTLTNSTGGTITARPITLTAVADHKTYDGTTSSSLQPQLSVGALQGSDTFTTRAQVFSNDNAGTGKTLTPTVVINDGNNGNNYLVTLANSTAGVIDKRVLRIVPGTASKVYDGTTASVVVPNVIGLQTGDSLSGSAAQIFDNRNVGSGKTLSATLGTLAISDGNSGNNYSVQLETADVGAITARPITLTAAPDSRSYDGSMVSTATPLITVGALQSGDNATLTQVYTTKNTGTGLTLVPSAVINDGNGGNNYTVTRVNSSNGTITKADIEISATTNTRQYDGTVNASNLPTISSGALQGTDGFSTFLQQYTSKNVGTSLTLVPTAVINDGNGGNNYNLSLVNSSGGAITARAIVVSAAADTKAYDRTTSSLVAPVLTSGSLVTGDTGNFLQVFDNANIGIGKTLTASGVVNDGNAGNNYAVTFLTSTSGTITQRPITVTAQTNTKTYDGTTSASATPGITQGSLLSGDVANFSQLYQSRNAGNGLTLIPTGSVNDGNGGQNYLVTFVNSANGVINARPITLTAAADAKSYDGSINSTATPSFTTGALQTGDTATLSQAFLSRNAGTGLTLIPSAVINDGNGGNNYVLSRVNSSNGTITRANIQITATTNSRQYDGSVNATALPTISSGALQGTDGFSTFAQQYTSRNVGTGLTLNPVAVINDGNSGNNYNVSLVSSSGGTITARPIVVSAAADSKAYDRTTSSSVIPVLTSGSLVSGDTNAFTQVFDNGNIGSGKTLTPSGVVSDGNGGANYAVTFLTSATGTITQRPITVTAQTNTKTYDGTTSAAAVPGITQGSLLSGDIANFTQSYQSRNAGSGLTLIPAGTVGDGNGGQNYLVTFVNSSNGIINPLDVTITAAAASKQYDGSVSSAVAPTLPGLLGADSFSGVGVQTYVDKNAGTGKTLTPALGTLVINDGNGGNNYRLNFQSASLGDITRAPLTVTATANSRVYNGGIDAVAVPVITGGSLKGSDTFSALTEVYASKNAGSGLTLIPSATINDGNGGNNYLVTLVNNTAGAITKATATLVANPVSKQYDGTTSSVVTPTFAGLLSGDTSTGTGSQVFSDKNVGVNKVLTPTQGTLSINDGNNGNNYNIVVSSTAVGTITPAPIEITGSSNTKTYDSTTSAAAAPTVTGGSLKAGDVFASLIQTYASDNAGTGITLTPSVAINDGNGGNNYAVTLVNSNNGVINRAPITITASTDHKTYDGSVSSSPTPQITSGVLFGTDGFTTLSQSFSTKGAGTGKTLVPVVTINDGNNGNNYAITAVNNLTGIIDPLAVTVSGSRTYNGLADTSAAANVLSLSNVIGSDAVTLSSGAGVIASGAAGAQALTSMGTLALSGADAGNYTLLGAGGLITINPLAINIALAGTRTYDATTAVSSSLLSIANNLDGANLTLSGTGTLGSANAGVQTLTSTAGALTGLSLSGAAAANYTTTGGAGTVTVSPRAITVAAQAGSKIYDGTIASTITPQLTGGSLAGNDSNGFIQQYSSRNVGSGLTLTPSGVVNDGNGGANYLVTFATSSGGAITPRSITVSPSSYTKVYDGTTTAGGAPVVTGGSVVSGDTANFTQVYSTDNAGTGLTLTPSGSVNDGNNGANYAIQFVGQNIGTITRRPITVTAQSNVKTYDGNTSATAAPSVTIGTIAFGDVAAFTEAYVLKNAGNNLTLTPSGIVNDGNSGANYDVTYVNSSNGTITPRSINLTAQNGSKQYDGSVNSALAPVLDALLGGDTFSGAASQRYGDANAGTGKTLIPSLGNLVINDGNSGNNYSIVAVNATSGQITRAPITVTASANTKTYDGTTASTALPSIASGVLYGVDAFGSLSQVYQGKNAGSGLTLIPSAVINDGNGGNNYLLTLVNNTSGVINKANVILAAQAATKVYDASVNTSVTPQLGQLFQGDTFSGSGAQTFTSSNAGSGLTLTPQLGTLAINDGNGGNNYNIVLATNANGVITPAALTLAAVSSSKAYDGSVNSTAIPTVSGLLGSDSVTGAPIQTYTGKNAGTNLTLVPALGTLTINDGNGGHNYAINAVNSGGGSITPALITVAAASNTKIYDGTLAAAAAPSITFGALQGSDTFTSLGEAYTGKNAGSGLTLVPAVVINDGNGGNNYAVTLINSTTGVINKATATLVANAATKTYDGNTSTVVAPSFEGLAIGDTVTGVGSQAFSNPNAGVNKLLTPSLGSLTINDGNNGNNYDIAVATRNNGTINPLAVQLTLNGTRMYDGTASMPSSLLTIGNNIDGSNLMLTGTGTLVSKNAGLQPLLMTGGAIDGISLAGSAASNYTVIGGSGLVSVTPVPITVSVSNGNKVYDGTLAAAVNPVVINGSLKGSDSFGQLTANYMTKNVGTGITITPNIVIDDGNSGNNYLVSVTPGIGDITPALATLTPTSLTKVYDGTTSSSVGPTVLGLAAGDYFTGAGSQEFNDRNAGSGKVLTPSLGSIVINDGNSGGNYILVQQNGIGTITPAPLTLTASAADKSYDGTTAASGTPTLAGLVAGDTAAGFGLQSFANKNAGINKELAPSLGSILISDGNGGNNYAINLVSSFGGTITPATLEVTAAADTKVYDGTTAGVAIPTITAGTLFSGDVAQFTNTFATRNVGTDITLTPTGSVNDGNNGGNYIVTRVARNDGSISPAVLTYVADTVTRPVGGSPVLTGSVTGFVGGDTMETAVSGTLSFTTSATTTSPEGSYSVVGGGLFASNYTFTQAASNSAALQIAGEQTAPTPWRMDVSALSTAVASYSALQVSPVFELPLIDVIFAARDNSEDEQEMPIRDNGVSLRAALSRAIDTDYSAFEEVDDVEFERMMRVRLKCPSRFTCSQKALDLRGTALGAGNLNTRSGPRVVP